MKRIACFLAGMLGVVAAFGQITIDQSDMPAPNDIYRVTASSTLNGIDLNQTGANQYWNFNFLTPLTVNGDTFIDPASAPLVYQAVFNDPLFYPNAVSTVSLNLLSAINLGALALTDVINFYKTTSDKYEQVGFGATVQGVQLPIEYDQHDILYELPLNYGDSYTHTLQYHLAVPGFSYYYGTTQYRNCDCDGWGTVETPAGQFTALRLKCNLDGADSIYADTIGGHSIARIPIVEYKWLAKGIKVPVLQINSTNVFGSEQITQVNYLSAKPTKTEDESLADEKCNVYPNPASQKSRLYIQSYKEQVVLVDLTDMEGRTISKVYSGNLNKGENQIPLNLESLSLDFGIYLIKIKTASEEKDLKLVIE